MRIRLRPYHPPWVVGYFGLGGMTESHNKRGFDYVLDAIRQNPDIEVEFVEGFDDICRRCDRLVKSGAGSVWGEAHTCTSAEDPRVVASVRAANRVVLGALGLGFGSAIALRELVGLLRERIPDLAQPGLEEAGGEGFQETYARGLEAVARLWR